MKISNLTSICKILIFSILILSSCSKIDDPATNPIDKKPIEEVPANNAPNTFDLIAVTKGATDVDVTPTFSWQAATDPEGDVVTYDLYLDMDENPTTIYAGNLITTTFKFIERLSLYETYYWKVVAKDAKDEISSAINDFSTRGLDFSSKPHLENAQFSPRSSHTTVLFDNKLWVIGGQPAVANSFPHNDVWFSENGFTWNEATSNGFDSRYYQTTTAFANKLWMIGGRYRSYDDHTPINRPQSILYSTDGVFWQNALEKAPFPERDNHTTTVFDNKLWVIGGYNGDVGNKNDIWYSIDGITWIEATTYAQFSARDRHTTVVFDNKLWVIGGFDEAVGNKNDVWYSTEGVTWTIATLAAPFSPRQSHTTAVFNNKLWVIGGLSFDNNGKAVINNDVWYSNDGVTWIEVIVDAPFSPRFFHTAAVFDNKLWVIGGFDGSDKNDVWAFD